MFWVLGSLLTSLLCIADELVGRGSVAVAVGIGATVRTRQDI